MMFWLFFSIYMIVGVVTTQLLSAKVIAPVSVRKNYMTKKMKFDSGKYKMLAWMNRFMWPGMIFIMLLMLVDNRQLETIDPEAIRQREQKRDAEIYELRERLRTLEQADMKAREEELRAFDSKIESALGELVPAKKSRGRGRR